ncbi:hypothetical protein [Candidatus Electronema sp. JM]|uniref:hypothetical protein n=1 Tax=Candidatus Electronema sp. JM TaxID=3401571 RepID=UPI003AA7F6E1
MKPSLAAIKKQFPEAARDIETLEKLGFASRSDGWIDSLDTEKAQTACWLLGKIGGKQDADTLLSILSGQRSELWGQAGVSLSCIARKKHITPLLTLFENSPHRCAAIPRSLYAFIYKLLHSKSAGNCRTDTC